jgi:hypothetical protein
LESFRRGAAPIAISQNARRLENGAGRSMANAPAKLELSKVVVAISPNPRLSHSRASSPKREPEPEPALIPSDAWPWP